MKSAVYFGLIFIAASICHSYGATFNDIIHNGKMFGALIGGLVLFCDIADFVYGVK
jgi:hypothetical protein